MERYGMLILITLLILLSSTSYLELLEIFDSE